MTKDRSSVPPYNAFLWPTRGLMGTETHLRKCCNNQEFQTSAGATLSPILLWLHRAAKVTHPLTASSVQMLYFSEFYQEELQCSADTACDIVQFFFPVKKWNNASSLFLF